MLPRLHRLTSTYDFNRVKRLGRGIKTPLFGIFFAPSKCKTDIRFGVIITNAIEKRAVYRNKAGRLVKKFFRDNLNRFHPGFDVVVVVYKVGLKATYEEISDTFNQTLSKTPLI